MYARSRHVFQSRPRALHRLKVASGCSFARAAAVDSTTASDIASRLRQAKDELAKEVVRLARGSLRKQLPCGYAFLERGSFWSPLIDDVTDVDLMFFRKRLDGNTPASIPLADAQMLHASAEQVLQVTVKYRLVLSSTVCAQGACAIEQELSDWPSCRRLIQAPPTGTALQAIVASGIYHSLGCNLLLPMDIALSCGSRESVSHRMDKIIKKVHDGDYAKALQKARAVLGKQKGARSRLVKRVNREVGWWRSAASQMEVLQKSADIVPLHVWQQVAQSTPGIPDTADTPSLLHLEALQKAWDAEAQKAARKVLVDLKQRIAMSFREPERTRFLQAVHNL